MVEAPAWKQYFAVGIDLGTSNSGCYVQVGNQAPRCVLMGSDRTIPSEVAFGTEISIGKRARSMASRKNPAALVKLVKYLIGKKCSQITEEQRSEYKNMFGADVDYSHADDVPRLKVQYQGEMKMFRPENISAFVLGHIKDAVMAEMNVPKENTMCEAVISVPARFLNNERNCTKDAAQIAGFNVLRVIPEPTAAIMSATYLKLLKEPQGTNANKVMVVDLGGGTFDVSMAAQHQDNLIEILGTEGDVMLGGADFTNAITKQLAEFFCQMYPDYNVNDLLNDSSTKKKLWRHAEEAKIAVNLQNSDRTEISVVLMDNDFEFDYTLKMFETVFKPFSERIKDIISRLMKKLDISMSQLDALLLVGGSCRIKAITDLLHELGANDRQINKELNYDEAVAMGACVQAFTAGKYPGKEDSVLLIDCVPANINIRTESDTAHCLIEANQSIPFRKTEVFSTGVDNQEGVTIHISEGPFKVASSNIKVGEFHLSGIQRAPRGVPQIEVTYEVDANGILAVSAKDKTTNVSYQIKCQDDRMSKEQIQKATEDYQKVKEEDDRIAALLKLKSQLNAKVMDFKDQISKTTDHPKHSSASNFLNDLSYELNTLTTDTIRHKDTEYFKSTESKLMDHADLKEVLSAAPAPDVNNNSAPPVAPNVEEAD